MTAASPFVVPVGELVGARRGSSSGRPRRVRIEAAVDWGVDASAVVPEPPLVADVELSAVSGGVLVRGRVTATVRFTCARCLVETDRVHIVAVDQLALPAGLDGGPGDGDDAYLVEGEVLDLEPLVRDELLLGLPLLWRCEPECAGSATGLGEPRRTGLNTGAPGRRSDSPFAALRDLLDTGE